MESQNCDVVYVWFEKRKNRVELENIQKKKIALVAAQITLYH